MASISALASLATFPGPSGSKQASTSKTHLQIAPVHGSDEPQAVAAVQGGAVWIYDLATNNAITSFTVPPDTIFSTSPICFHARLNASESSLDSAVKRGKRKERRTVLGVARGEDVASNEEGKVLWIWKGDDTFEKVKLSLSHKVEAIEWTPQSECFVAASADRVTFISSDLAPTTLTIPGSKGKKKTLRKLLMLPRTSKSIQAIVLIYSNGTAMHLGFSDWDGAAKLESHKELTVPKGVLHQGEEIVDGHLNGTKSIHLQTSTNRLLASSISLIGSSASSCAVSYHLAASEKPSTPSALAAIPSATGTLLLAADEKPSFILFQPTYPSVLAAREIPFTGSQVHSIVRLSESMVGLVTSSSKDATGTGRSMVHTLEFTLPSQGVGIAQMLESASLTRAYLRLSEVSPAASSHSLTKESDKEVEAVQARDAAFFASLESALKEGLAKAAEDVFAKWQTEEKAAIASHASQPKSKTMQAIQGRSKTAFASKAVNMILSQAIHGTSTPPKTTEDVQESTQSQAELYEGPATRTPRGAYPKSILTALLEMGWVSDRMWKESGGVITGGFLVLGDWSNVILALQKIKTISSTTLVILLNRVLQKSSTLNTINSSMSDISATSPVPTLARYLRTMVTVPISAPLHRIALHRGLNVEGANAVLAVLVQWFEEDNEIEGSKEGGSAFGKGWEEMMGLPEMATEATKRGAKKKGPGLQLVIQHLTILLDSHLPLLLSHLPAHPLLERLQLCSQPLISSQTELLLAKGTIDAFIRQHEKEAQQHRSKGSRSSGSAGGAKKQGTAGVPGATVIREFAGGVWRLEEVKL